MCRSRRPAAIIELGSQYCLRNNQRSFRSAKLLTALKAFQRTKLLKFDIQLKNLIAYSPFSSPLHLRVKSKTGLNACVLRLMFLVTWLRKGWKQIDREPADRRLTPTLWLAVSWFTVC